MKKIISILLVAGIMITMFAYSFVNAQTNATVSVSSVSGNPGDEVVVDVSVSTDTPCVAIECNIEYLTSALELIEVIPYDEFFPEDSVFLNDDLSTYPYYIGWENSMGSGLQGSGKLVGLKFRIKSDCYNGVYPVDAIVNNIIDNNLNDIYYVGEAGFITVSGGEESPYSTTMRTTTTKPTFPTTTTQKPSYTVILDSVGKRVEEGDEYIFPESEKIGFICYTDGESFYQAGDKLSIDKDYEFKSLSMDLKMLKGASMRLKDPSGMRFYTVIDEQQIADLKSNYNAQIQFGTLITPMDYLDSDELTHNMKNNYIDVKYTSNIYYEENEIGFKGVVGSIANVLLKNANRQFVGRGYAKITIGEITKTIYANYSENDINNNTRKIAYIANMFKYGDNKDGVTTKEYNDLSERIKAYVDKYADLYVAPDPKDPHLPDKF